MSLEENYIMTETLFFDTYAFIEIIKHNENYNKYRSNRILTTKLNIFELYYYLLKNFHEDVIDIIISEYYKLTVDFDRNIIENAAKLRFMNNKLNLSMTDCIGYCTARKHGIKFLTGDKGFENMPNVEFVK